MKRLTLTFLALMLGGLVAPVDAQFRRDTTRVNDQEFLRLLKQADEHNEEQQLRAQRTHNSRILMRLAADEDPGVRFRVAFNPYTPAETLRHLAGDPNPTVRWGVARNDRLLFEIDTSFVADLDQAGNLIELSRLFGRAGLCETGSTASRSNVAAWVCLSTQSRSPGKRVQTSQRTIPRSCVSVSRATQT